MSKLFKSYTPGLIFFPLFINESQKIIDAKLDLKTVREKVKDESRQKLKKFHIPI